MANIINAKIYKSRIPACKFAKKVNGQISKKYIPEIKTHGKYAISDKMAKCQYIVTWGNYKKL